MKKIILLTLIAFISLGIDNGYSISDTEYNHYIQIRSAIKEHGAGGVYGADYDRFEYYAKELKREAQQQACKQITSKVQANNFMFFPERTSIVPTNCSSDPDRKDIESMAIILGCKDWETGGYWKVGDYTDDGILLYYVQREFIAGRLVDNIEGTRIFVYTDNTDFVTDECFYDEYVYEKTKNFKYTSTMGRTIVVRAYKKTDVKYKDIITKTYDRR